MILPTNKYASLNNGIAPVLTTPSKDFNLEEAVKLNTYKIQPYYRPKKDLLKNYAKIKKNGRVLIHVSKQKNFFVFRRFWENQFGGGSSNERVILIESPLHFGNYSIPKELYDKWNKVSIIGKKAKLVKAKLKHDSEEIMIEEGTKMIVDSYIGGVHYENIFRLRKLTSSFVYSVKVDEFELLKNPQMELFF